MAEQVITHPIAFDSAAHPDFAACGLPFRVRLPVEEIELPVSLHLAGVFEIRVLNAPLNRLAAPTDEELSGGLLSALSATLAAKDDFSGLPEQLLLRGGSLYFGVEERLREEWRERFGLALQGLVFTDCRLFPEDRDRLDRLLRGEVEQPEPEPEPEPPAAPAQTQGRRLSPSQAELQKALEELNARRRAMTEGWKKD